MTDTNILLFSENFKIKLAFLSNIVYTIKSVQQRALTITYGEVFSNGKEPHWKCGVPQGIVRSNRILSARVKSEYSLYSDFLYFLENYVELKFIYDSNRNKYNMLLS